MCFESFLYCAARVQWNVGGERENIWPGAAFIDGRRLWQVSSSHRLSSAFSVSQLDEELKQNLQATMQQKYQQPGEESVTQAVDKLQQEVFNWIANNNSGAAAQYIFVLSVWSQEDLLYQ